MPLIAANLWVNMIESVEDDVLMRAKQDVERYQQLRNSSNCLGLYNLLQETVFATGINSTAAIKTKFYALRPSHYRSVAAFLEAYDSYIGMLQDTSSSITENEKVEQLCEAMRELEDYKVIVAPVRTKAQVTTYSKFKDILIRQENDLTLRSVRDKSGEVPAMSAFEKSGWKRKSEFHDDKDRRKKRQADITCHNCGRKNHLSFECRSKKTVCNFCKKEGHQEKYCRKKATSKPQDKKTFTTNKRNGKKEAAKVAVVADAASATVACTDDNLWNDDKSCTSEFGVMANEGCRFCHKHAMVSGCKYVADRIILDSGATIHVFSDSSIPEKYSTPQPVSDSTKINGIAGSVRVVAKGFIPNFGRYYIVPGATANLISIREFCSNSPLKVEFAKSECTISADSEKIPPLVIKSGRDNTYSISLEKLHKLIRVAKSLAQSSLENEYVLEGNIASGFNSEVGNALGEAIAAGEVEETENSNKIYSTAQEHHLLQEM